MEVNSSKHLETILIAWHIAQEGLIEPTWAQKRRVNQVWPTRSREHIDAIETLGTVHLREHLVDDTVRHPG